MMTIREVNVRIKRVEQRRLLTTGGGTVEESLSCDVGERLSRIPKYCAGTRGWVMNAGLRCLRLGLDFEPARASSATPGNQYFRCCSAHRPTGAIRIDLSPSDHSEIALRNPPKMKLWSEIRPLLLRAEEVA